jgi:SAM-dependent methyltransferase
MVFDNYAKYYNLLYKDKDYKNEVNYIDLLIKKYSKNNKESKRILDIGCGTGIHANYLAEKGFNVTGIDFSKEMISIANRGKSKNTRFFVYDATSFDLSGKFDIILSLFHVVSYQIENQNIKDLFVNVSKHLRKNGLFIFDFWYGPAVLSEGPSVRIKRLEDNDIKIVRLAEPEMMVNNNIVKVNYELLITDKLSKKSETINETHNMRYLFIPEIESYLKSCNLNALHYEEWMTGNEPSLKTWGVCCIAKRI